MSETEGVHGDNPLGMDWGRFRDMFRSGPQTPEGRSVLDGMSKADFIDETQKDDRIVQALRELKDSGKHKLVASAVEKMDGLIELHEKLKTITGKPTILEFDDSFGDKTVSSGGSHWDRALDKIVMKGKFSLLTFLTMWGMALGKDALVTRKFSTTHYKAVFPVLWERLEYRDGMFIAPTSGMSDAVGEARPQ